MKEMKGEVFGGNDWFGCRNMLVIGDLLQLKPVNGSPIRISHNAMVQTLMCSLHLFSSIVIELFTHIKAALQDLTL